MSAALTCHVMAKERSIRSIMQVSRVSGSRSWALPSTASVALSSLWLAVFIPDADRLGAAEAGKRPATGSTTFSIPSQQLGAALEIYARVSGREVLYDGALADGRLSGLVDGIYTPEVALQILLAGTGLRADFKDANFFVIGLAPAAQTARDTAGRSPENRRYYGELQASLKAAFCGTGVVPDSSRIAARLWIGQTGQVLQVKTLSPTGNDGLDERVEATLLRLNLRFAPPPGFAQPITIVVLPSSPDARENCSGLHPPIGTRP